MRRLQILFTFGPNTTQQKPFIGLQPQLPASYRLADCESHQITSHLNGLTVKKVKQSPKKSDIQRVQTNYCKFVLGLLKYASSEACAGESGPLPLRNRVQSLAVRYWLCMEQGTPNILLNATFDCAKSEFHLWMQDVRHLLYSNGLGVRLGGSMAKAVQ